MKAKIGEIQPPQLNSCAPGGPGSNDGQRSMYNNGIGGSAMSGGIGKVTPISLAIRQDGVKLREKNASTNMEDIRPLGSCDIANNDRLHI